LIAQGEKMKSWTAEALNTAPDSSNKIHGDELAKQYGFQGGLVPGVTISAYLIHPAIELWKEEWLNNGYADCRITSPLYDKELFIVDADVVDKNKLNTTLIKSNGTISANAEISLSNDLSNPPIRRGDTLVDNNFVPPEATFEVWKKLESAGCKAFRFNWGGQDPLVYLKDSSLLPDLLQPSLGGMANLSFLLGCSNWILAGNAYMNPWVHLQTVSQNYKAVSMETNLIAEMSVNKFYEKKGHEFIDVDVNLFDEKDNSCAMTINLVAIFKLRGS
jgi:hypothetical protein